MHEAQPMTDDGGWDGVHLGEATAHAWLDGALPPDEAARAEAHVATCADCTALVAEARGLIAGASRILGALDAVPAGVLPAAAPVVRARAPRRWWSGVPARAAAALLLLAGGSTVVLRERGGAPASAAASRSFEMAAPQAVADSAAVAAPTAAPAIAPAIAPAVAPPAAPRAVAARRAVREAIADVAPAPPAAPAIAPMSAPMPAPPATAPPPAPVGVAGGIARGEARRESAAKATAADAMVAERPAAAPARVQSLVESFATAAGVIAGRVLTPDGRPVPQAQVQIAGTAAGATTDSAGAFRLRSPVPGTATLQARRIGYDQGTTTVAVTGADTVTATVVLTPARLALNQVVVTGSASLPAAWRDAARGAVGCWAVRAGRGWTAAAPALPDVVQLTRTEREGMDGAARVADEPGRAAWREGEWTVTDSSAIAVTLPATGGAAELALRRDGRGWRGTATWTATPPATRAAAPVDVRLETTRCPAR